MRLNNVEIKSNQAINKIGDVYKMGLYSEFICNNASPGQFLHIECSPTFDPLLRRPFSINDVDYKNKIVYICYALIGGGTRQLKRKRAGDELSVLGPLGKGFSVVPDTRAYVVGGGIGSAPLLFLTTELARKAREIDVNVLLGASSDEYLIQKEEFNSRQNVRIRYATDDGSYGSQGTVTELLEPELERARVCELNDMIIYSCGPLAMLKKVKELSLKYKIPAQLSFETKMACGVGACLGCAIKTGDYYSKACNEGPVFRADEVEIE